MRAGLVRLSLVLLSASNLMLSPAAMAAAAGPSVHGRVLLAGSSQSIPLANATVRLISAQTGNSHTTFTDSQGIFAFYDIPRGRYEFQVHLSTKVEKQQKDEKLLDRRSLEVSDTDIKVPDVLVRSTEPDTRTEKDIVRAKLIVEGTALAQREEWARALKVLNEAERIQAKGDPADDSPLYHNRGWANLMVGNLKQARRDFEKAASFEITLKGKADSLENVPLVSLREGNWKEALRFTGELNEIYTASSWNWLFRYIAADKLGDKAEAEAARKQWETLRGRNSSSSTRWLRIGLPKDLQGYLAGGNTPREVGASG